MRSINKNSPELAQLFELYHQGMTYSEIGRIMQKDHTTIMYHVRRAGIPQRRIPAIPMQGKRGRNRPKVGAYIDRVIKAGPGRCPLCFILLMFDPTHDKTHTKEPYYTDLIDGWGNSAE